MRTGCSVRRVRCAVNAPQLAAGAWRAAAAREVIEVAAAEVERASRGVVQLHPFVARQLSTELNIPTIFTTGHAHLALRMPTARSG